MQKKSLLISILSIIITVIVVTVIVFAESTWNGPTDIAPKNNTDTPINVGNAEQVKKGGIRIGEGLSANDVAVNVKGKVTIGDLRNCNLAADENGKVVCSESGVSTCTQNTFGDWGRCSASRIQTRAITFFPEGCTGGGSTIDVRQCPTCEWSWSGWYPCEPDGTQYRISAPSDATCGVARRETRGCTYNPPPRCTSYSVGSYGVCSGGMRDVSYYLQPAGCVGGNVVLPPTRISCDSSYATTPSTRGTESSSSGGGSTPPPSAPTTGYVHWGYLYDPFTCKGTGSYIGKICAMSGAGACSSAGYSRCYGGCGSSTSGGTAACSY